MLAKILTVKLYQDCCFIWEHTVHVVMHGISLAEEDMWRKWDIIKAFELTSEYSSIILELCLLYSHSWAILILPVKADIVVLSRTAGIRQSIRPEIPTRHSGDGQPTKTCGYDKIPY